MHVNEPSSEANDAVPSVLAPPKKRARTDTPESKPLVKPRRRIAGTLSWLMKMPVDIFIEVSMRLHPLDLLHLSRTNHHIRHIVLARHNRYIWLSSFAQVEGLPGAPDFLNEPQYAAFLFELVCQHIECKRRVVSADYNLTLRLCQDHFPAKIISTADANRLLRPFNLTTNCIRKHSSKVTRYFLRQPGLTKWASGWWSRDDLDRIVTRLKARCGLPARWSESKSAIKEIVNEEERRCKLEKKRASKTSNWAEEVKYFRSQELQIIGEERATEIRRRLVERGWDEKDMSIDDDLAHENKELRSILYKSAPLTESIWTQSLPPLKRILRERSAYRLKREAKTERKRRLELIKSLIVEFAEHEAEHICPIPTSGLAATVDRQLYKDIARITTTSNFPTKLPPSVIHFLDPTSLEPSLERLLEVGEALRSDLRLMIMRDRDALAMVVRWADGDLMPLEEHAMENWLYCRTRWNRQELEERDAANLERLLQPGAIFTVQGKEPLYWAQKIPMWASYPAVLEHIESVDGGLAKRNMVTIQPIVKILTEQLGVSNSSVYDLVMRSSSFLCESCPVGVTVPSGWLDLVMHIAQEREWHSQLKHKLHLKSLIDTHSFIRVTVPSPAQLDEARVALKANDNYDEGGRWRCTLCPNLNSADESKFDPDVGLDLTHLSQFPATSAKVELHLKHLHGLEGEDADEYITTDSSAGIRPSRARAIEDLENFRRAERYRRSELRFFRDDDDQEVDDGYRWE